MSSSNNVLGKIKTTAMTDITPCVPVVYVLIHITEICFIADITGAHKYLLNK